MALVLQLEPQGPLVKSLYTKMRSFQTLATLVSLMLFASKEAAALPTSTNSVGDLEARQYYPGYYYPSYYPGYYPSNLATSSIGTAGNQIGVASGNINPTSTNYPRDLEARQYYPGYYYPSYYPGYYPNDAAVSYIDTA